MESLRYGVFGFRSREDVEAYVQQMNEDAREQEPLPARVAMDECQEAWRRTNMQLSLDV